MSNQAISWALDIPTGSPATKVLLLVLANYANENCQCFPGVERLAREADMSPSSVKRHMAHLIELGLVTRDARGDAEGGRRSNQYTLSMPAKLADLPAQSEPKGADGYGVKNRGVRGQKSGGLGSPVTPEPIEPIEPTVLPAPKPKRVAVRLPEGWKPDHNVIEQMRRERPDVDLKAEHAKFTDHWRAKPGRDATKLDWNATWRNWIRNARADGRKPPLQAVPAYAPTPAAPRESLPWTDAS
jgi:Helix-turn-helix domain